MAIFSDRKIDIELYILNDYLKLIWLASIVDSP